MQQSQWLSDYVHSNYKCFDAVFGTDTTDCDRATAATKPVKRMPESLRIVLHVLLLQQGTNRLFSQHVPLL